MADLNISVYDTVKVSRSLVLNGSGYASIADGSQTGLDMGLSDFMLEAWVKVLDTSPSQRIIAKENTTAAGNAGYDVYIYLNVFHAYIGDATTRIISVGNVVVPVAGWFSIIVVFDRENDIIRHFLNGVEDSNVTNSDISSVTGSVDNDQKVTVGCRWKNGSPDAFLSGYSNEFRIWNFGVAGLPADYADYITWRYANPNAPTSEYNSGGWNTYVTNNLKAYYKFNGDYVDETSNSNDLAASGSGNVFDESEYGSFGANLHLLPSVHDGVSVAEDVGRKLTSFINVNDATSIAESISMAMSNLKPSVYDNISVADIVAMLMPFYNISVYDSVAVAEHIKTLEHLFISKHEDVAVAEAASALAIVAGINVYDSVSVLEKVYFNWWQAIVKDDTTWSDITKDDTAWSDVR